MKKNTLLITLTTLLCSSLTMANQQKMIENLTEFGLTNIQITDSGINGLQTITTDQDIFYSLNNGEYIFQAPLFKMTDGKLINITNQSLLKKLNSFSDSMIVFPAKKEKYVITVFTDFTCHYCVLLHDNLPAYNDLGITVRYMAYPRKGEQSEVAKQMEAIFKAEDPNYAFNQAKNGELPKKLLKPDIVAKHHAMGKAFKIKGTPAIVLPSGYVVGGYVKPDELLKILIDDAKK